MACRRVLLPFVGSAANAVSRSGKRSAFLGLRALGTSNQACFADASNNNNSNNNNNRDDTGKKQDATSPSASNTNSSSSSSSADGKPKSTASFLDAVLTKARMQRTEDDKRPAQQQGQQGARGNDDSDGFGRGRRGSSGASQSSTSSSTLSSSSSSLHANASNRRTRRRRMTASQREKVIPSFDFVSDPETRKMVRNAYKYGPLSMTKLQQFLTPERSAALEQDLRPEHMLQDLASEFPEVMEMIAAEREANAVAETVDSSAHVSHSAAQAASITFEKDKEGASSFKDLPPAVASMLSTSARVNTSATSGAFLFKLHLCVSE